MQKAGLKNRVIRLVLWSGLSLILLLMALSIYGAFIGAEAAQRFFNSIPLTIYWLALTLLLISAILTFRRLLQIRGLFLIHIGCVLVLAGGIWGSQAGFKIRDSLFGTDTIRSGKMIVYKGMTDKAVETEQGGTKLLPFSIKLVDFRLEYYRPGLLLIRTITGEGYKIPAEPGTKYDLGDNLGSVEIVKKFDRFKLIFEGDKRIAIDDPNGRSNPALEILLIKSDGSRQTRYAFERFPGHVNPNDNLTFSYRRMVRDFISDVEVIEDNKPVAKKSIEVNKPLRFEGYLFYQQGYDDQAGRYTILSVTSDNGLGIVYLGYIILCAGVFWHFWFSRIFHDREIYPPQAD